MEYKIDDVSYDARMDRVTKILGNGPHIPDTPEQRVNDAMGLAYRKAIDSLGRYKFLMFGYHAAQWVTLNKLLDRPRSNAFKEYVDLAKLRKL